jgi:hypothetical protein
MCGLGRARQSLRTAIGRELMGLMLSARRCLASTETRDSSLGSGRCFAPARWNGAVLAGYGAVSEERY